MSWGVWAEFERKAREHWDFLKRVKGSQPLRISRGFTFDFYLSQQQPIERHNELAGKQSRQCMCVNVCVCGGKGWTGVQTAQHNAVTLSKMKLLIEVNMLHYCHPGGRLPFTWLRACFGSTLQLVICKREMNWERESGKGGSYQVPVCRSDTVFMSVTENWTNW